MHCSDHLWSQLSVPSRCVLSIWRLSGVDCRPTRARALGYCLDTRASGEMWQTKQLNSCYKSHFTGTAMCTPWTLLGHQLMKLSKLLLSSSDRDTKQALGEECIQSRRTQVRRAGRHSIGKECLFRLQDTEAFCDIFPSEVKGWEFSFHDQIYSIP